MKLIDLNQTIFVPVVDETNGGMTVEMQMTVGEFFRKFCQGFEPNVVDAMPVIHARQIWINPLDPGAKMCTWKCSSLCSACGDYVATGWKHCQNCGAKMDGKRRDDDAAD